MILIMKILLHNEYKIINLWYPTYVYQFFNFPYNYENRVMACFQTRPKTCNMTLVVWSNKRMPSHYTQEEKGVWVPPKQVMGPGAKGAQAPPPTPPPQQIRKKYQGKP